MSDQSLNDIPPEKLTVDEWIQRIDELGYFITKPQRVYETKGWQAVIEFLAILLCIGLVLGGMSGGLIIGTKYYDCGEHHGE